MIITIARLSIDCVIGCLEEERLFPQKLWLDISYEITPPEQDALSATIDYTQVIDCCKTVAVEGKFFLLETLAQKACSTLFAQFPSMHSLTIKAMKPTAIEDAFYCSAEYSTKR